MINIIEAILAINPNASASVDDSGKITWHDGNPSGMTIEQITEKQAALAIQAELDATTKKNRMDSVKTKLEGLGLTAEEVKEAFGI